MIDREFHQVLGRKPEPPETKGHLMQLAISDKLKITAEIFSILLLISILMVIIANCSDKETPQTQSGKKAVESFTFFDLGRNSVLSNGIRDELSTKLGNDAIEGRMILDLEINYPGFLKTYFPQLNELNRQLNYPPGERVDHNTVKLMYRYAQRKSVPFEYVELIFSNYTKNPILFRINFQKDESNIIETLRQKYGIPKTVEWQKENGSSFYWAKNQDVLIVSLVPDQFGNPGYQIVIYFTENLEELIRTEQMEKEKMEQKRAKSGKTAF